jgi:hypothetical protein
MLLYYCWLPAGDPALVIQQVSMHAKMGPWAWKRRLDPLEGPGPFCTG